MIKRANLSTCGRYRYSLSRTWDADTAPLVFVMLNPSRADDNFDDPTIRRCMGFARREKAGGIVVVNLFALRTPSTKELGAAADPIGSQNDAALLDILEMSRIHATPVICAWGTLGGDRAGYFLSHGRGSRLACLGKTKDGHPRHPLYVRADQPLEPFP